MAVIKCPRCEINFMRDDEECCSVCMRELRKEKKTLAMEDDAEETCVECGLAPAITKDGLCAQCALDAQSFERVEPVLSNNDSDSSDDALDIISLELVEDDDDDDLLEFELQDLAEGMDFEDEDALDDFDEEENDAEGEGFIDVQLARHA